MKREELFEALSDIDEDLVAAARTEEEASAPIAVTPKKIHIRPFGTVAACIALAAALITVIAVNANRIPKTVLSTDTPEPDTQEQSYRTSITTVVNTSRYPESVYPYTGDFSNLEINYICDTYPYSLNDPEYKSYDELAADSSLIVMGTFIYDTSQVTEANDVPDFTKSMLASYYNKYISLNTLKVEKVLKSNGQVWEGDEIVIAQPYVNADGGMYSFSQLTPMIKGDSWVYFLDQYSNDYPEEIYGTGAYYPVNDYEGRYPVPDNENPSFQYRENTKGVVAPATFNESIYDELKEKLEGEGEGKRPPYEIESKKVTDIAKELGIAKNYPIGISIEFEMGEFEGAVFGINKGTLYVRTSVDPEDKNTFFGGTDCYINIGSTYLCDLNGDGKREICTEISFGLGISSNLIRNNFVWVLDYAENKGYCLSAPGKYDYFLRERNGELEYIQREFDMTGEYPTGDLSGDILTLDIMMTDEEENNGSDFATAETNSRIILFSSEFTSVAAEAEYELTVFMYNLIDETETELYGYIAAEISSNGEAVSAAELWNEGVSANGTTYCKDMFDEYFKVVKLDGGDVLVFSLPDRENGDKGLANTAFYTVRDGNLTVIERYLTDKEQEEWERDLHSHSSLEKVYFKATDKFTAEGDRIIFDLSSEVAGVWPGTDVSFPAGEIPLIFDFDNCTVKCEAEEYEELVYYH